MRSRWYIEGAFSGAIKGGKIGKIELANKGTLLLDEIGEMPMQLQSKLLRVLQEKELERVGSNKTVKLDTQIICSTNQNIESMVFDGTFRQDLYFRINTIELHIPSLHERLPDIPLLCEFFIQKINQIHGCHITGISDHMLQHFYNYKWPGNIRELEHVLERACVMSSNGILEVDHFDFFMPRIYQKMMTSNLTQPTQGSLSYQKDQFEKNSILQALEKTGGNKSKAAIILGITRSQLYEKFKKYNLC